MCCNVATFTLIRQIQDADRPRQVTKRLIGFDRQNKPAFNRNVLPRVPLAEPFSASGQRHGSPLTDYAAAGTSSSFADCSRNTSTFSCAICS